MRNYFLFNGVDSRDYGVYISGQGTFSAPQKAYQFYNIPGRNGALLGNEHRLENISVSYEAFIYTNFDENLAAFRSFLLSINGYARLTDSYHPDEYRMAVYTGPFEPKVESKNDCGSFTITFSCKPQRYLFSGDTKYSWASGTEQTITGTSVDVYGPRVDPSVLTYFYSLHPVTPIQPQYYYDSQTQTMRLISFTMPRTPQNWSTLPSQYKCAIIINDETVRTQNMVSSNFTQATFDFANGTFSRRGKLYDAPTTSWTMVSSGLFYHSLTGVDIVHASTHYSQSPQLTYLNGSLDAQAAWGFYWDQANSRLYVRDSRFSSASAFQNWLSSESNSGRTVRFDCIMTTPETQSIPTYTPAYPDGFITVKGLSGFSVTVKYTAGNTMANPTEFPSEPLIRAYGDGVFEMDGVTITIANSTSYTDIDCEMMDCYEGTTNRNDDVTFSTYDFPKLRSGENSINIVSGITILEIQPRWWRV